MCLIFALIVHLFIQFLALLCICKPLCCRRWGHHQRWQRLYWHWFRSFDSQLSVKIPFLSDFQIELFTMINQKSYTFSWYYWQSVLEAPYYNYSSNFFLYRCHFLMIYTNAQSRISKLLIYAISHLLQFIQSHLQIINPPSVDKNGLNLVVKWGKN